MNTDLKRNNPPLFLSVFIRVHLWLFPGSITGGRCVTLNRANCRFLSHSTLCLCGESLLTLRAIPSTMRLTLDARRAPLNVTGAGSHLFPAGLVFDELLGLALSSGEVGEPSLRAVGLSIHRRPDEPCDQDDRQHPGDRQ